MSKSCKRSSRILFVGNSFTARNDLPDLIAQLASARGVRIEHALMMKNLPTVPPVCWRSSWGWVT